MNYRDMLQKWIEENPQVRELPSMTMWYIADFADWLNKNSAQQMLALDPPSALVCSCGSVAGIHCDWCPCANTAVK